MRPRDQEREGLAESRDIDERSGNAGLQAGSGKGYPLSEGQYDGAFDAPSVATTVSAARKINSYSARRISAAAASGESRTKP